MSAWLIDTVLYTGVLIALVLVLRRPVGRFFGPQLAYALWGLPFLRLLLPPITLPASYAPEPAPVPADLAPMVFNMPAEAPLADAATPPIAEATATAAPPPAEWEWVDLIAPAVSLWAGVALAFLLFRVVTYQRMRAELLKGARPVGEIGKVRLVESPALASPVAFGVLDKVVALPPLFMAQPDIVARDLAIEHELAHHKGHDLLANFAAQALLALHWFNPLAWYGWRAMRRDQEAACDARVLAGRGREERLRYAALIAGIATGPRSLDFKAALAAPMACPVLGERSIVHRLRSLSMSEKSRRRRWFGRSLVATSALALPLTASISYAAANAQIPEAAPAEVAETTETAQSDAAESGFVRHVGPDGKHTVRDLTPHSAQFHPHGDWDSEEFRASMENLQRDMEQFRQNWDENHDWEKYGEQWAEWGRKYGEQWGKHWEKWGEEQREQALAHAEQAREQAAQHREQALAYAEQQREQALASAQAARNAPVVVRSCDEDDTTHTTEDGRPRIVICPSEMRQRARSSLRTARESIAHNREMSDEVRAEVLSDLDAEIERIEREED